jgi:hypothetical protein
MNSVVSCRWHDETQKWREVEPTCLNTEVTWRNSTWPGNQLPGVQDTMGSRTSPIENCRSWDCRDQQYRGKATEVWRIHILDSYFIASLSLWMITTVGQPVGWPHIYLKLCGNKLPTSYTVFQLQWQWRYRWGIEGPLRRPPPGSGLLISTASQDSAAVYGETVVDKASASRTVPKHINSTISKCLHQY